MILYTTKLIKVTGLAIALVLTFLVTPGLVKDAGQPNRKSKATQTNNTDASKKAKEGLAASKIGIDRDGAIRPVSPAEEKKLNAEFLKALSRYRKHQPKKNADGSISLVLAPYSLSASVAHRTSDGKIEVDCTQDLQTPGHQIRKATEKNPDQLPEE